MQEVKGFLHGERNYLKMYGNTGPLVYPAGFVYIFSFLYWITNEGSDILTGNRGAHISLPQSSGNWNLIPDRIFEEMKHFDAGQYIFAGLYLANLAIVFSLYQCGHTESPNIAKYAALLLVFSKRIHSIFILRLFNDCIAVACGYVAILLFTKRKVASTTLMSFIYLMNVFWLQLYHVRLPLHNPV